VDTLCSSEKVKVDRTGLGSCFGPRHGPSYTYEMKAGSPEHENYKTNYGNSFRFRLLIQIGNCRSPKLCPPLKSMV
jgi:hypothetical protein